MQCAMYVSVLLLLKGVVCNHPHLVVVVDPPLLRVAVGGGPTTQEVKGSPARRPFHLASRGTTLPGDIQRTSMLLEVYKCVQLNICSVVCGCVLQMGKRGLDRCG